MSRSPPSALDDLAKRHAQRVEPGWRSEVDDLRRSPDAAAAARRAEGAAQHVTIAALARQLDLGEHLAAEDLRRGCHGATVDPQCADVGGQRRVPAHRERRPRSRPTVAFDISNSRGRPLCQYLEQCLFVGLGHVLRPGPGAPRRPRRRRHRAGRPGRPGRAGRPRSAPPSAAASSRALPISSWVPSETCPPVCSASTITLPPLNPRPFMAGLPGPGPRARSRPTIWSATSPALPVSISACPVVSGRCIRRTTRPSRAAGTGTISSVSPPACMACLIRVMGA